MAKNNQLRILNEKELKSFKVTKSEFKQSDKFISDFIKYTPLAGFILLESTTILAVGKPKFFPLPSPLITFPVKRNSYPSRAFASIILPSDTKFLTFVELIELKKTDNFKQILDLVMEYKIRYNR